jgi:hypothetical protein
MRQHRIRLANRLPGLRAAIGRQEIFSRRGSGRRNGVDEIHDDNRLAEHGEPSAACNVYGHFRIIDISDFYECHEFFETFRPLPRP